MPSSTQASSSKFSPLKKLQGHTRHVCALAFLSDSYGAVSGSNDRSARIWDIPTAQAIGEPLRGHDDWVDCVAVSPDDRRLLTGDADGKIRVWDMSTMQLIGEPWDAHGGSPVTCLTWSPDGRRIASCSSDETSLMIWDAASPGALEMSLTSEEQESGGWLRVAFSPDGTRLAAGSCASATRGATISIWDTENRILMVPFIRGHDDDICSLSWSVNGKSLASGSRDGIFQSWETETGYPIGDPLDLQVEKTFSVALSAKDALLAVASNGDIHLWDLKKRQRRHYALSGTGAYHVVFSPNGDYLASYGHSCDITIWDMKPIVEEDRETVKRSFLDSPATSISSTQMKRQIPKLSRNPSLFDVRCFRALWKVGKVFSPQYHPC